MTTNRSPGPLSRLLDASILLSFDRNGYRRHAAGFDPKDLQVVLAGRVCLVTGANSGIGFETSLALAARGGRVWILCRNRERGLARAFVVYLSCGKRPIHELLFPQRRDIRHGDEHNFHGMTADPVPLDALIATRERLVRQVQRELDDDERGFPMSLVRAEPDWSLLGIAHLEKLPGVRWKLQNLLQLQKVNASKFAEQADALVYGFESVR